MVLLGKSSSEERSYQLRKTQRYTCKPRQSSLLPATGALLTLTFTSFAPEVPVRGVTEETCLGEEVGSGHTAGLEGLIKGSELPGGGRWGLGQGLVFRVLAQEGVDVLNINIKEIKSK